MLDGLDAPEARRRFPDGDVTVTGALARVGQRFMSTAAKSQFDRFFERLQQKVG